MGPLNYEVNIDGYTCQAHIDHILPCGINLDDSNDKTSDNTPPRQQEVASDMMSTSDDTVVPLSCLEADDCDAANPAHQELVTLQLC